MSEISTIVTADHYRYIEEHTASEDDFLKLLKREARSKGIPPIWISPEQSSLMQILLKLCNAREVIEIGTLAGYSAIAMARALPEEGRVRTIEISGGNAEFARRWVARSDVSGRVEIYHGAGKDVLPTFAGDSADAAFVDADKVNYPLYLRESLRIVRRGGLLMVDNAFAFGYLLDENCRDREVQAVRDFNDIMAKTKEVHSIIAPIGDGCWVGIRH